MSLQQFAELLSLGLTLPTIALAVAVVVTWYPAAKVAAKANMRTGEQWFVLGVTAGFIGAALDNLFWAFPWSAKVLGDPSLEWMFSAGVYSNLVCRQGLGITAAYCHLRASEATSQRGMRWLNRLLVVSHLVGIFFCVGLVVAERGWLWWL